MNLINEDFNLYYNFYSSYLPSWFKERIHVIEQSENEMNLQRAREAKEKTEHVMKLEESAKIRREQDVNDSTMVCK